MNRFSENDRRFMQRALELARKVKGTTFPNPAVGAVVVKNGTIISEGATASWGGPHAEKTALRKAGADAANAMLYVTLEPCCHFGKTPPCTDTIIDAGIRRVIAAHRDPNPLVAGKGVQILRRAGIDVASGLLGKEARQLNEDFCHVITTGRAFITLKLALTLDGFIADANGDSKWITSSSLRHIVHDLRRGHAAIAVGSGTLLADNPQLTVRTGRKALRPRIVFSSTRNVPLETRFLRNAKEVRSIVVIRKKARQRIEADSPDGVEYWYTGSSDSTESMQRFTQMAANQHLNSVFIEGGGTIAAALLKAGLVNRLYLFYGNQILGQGISGIPLQPGLAIVNAITLKDRKSIRVGNDMYVTGIPVYP
jgi:diaminohydroxyphosphoribosylaminopyrimidine deaminase / 5-amino-6-(5-phosphoribosylamino)uracil reductase